jgi:hypothetical protein
MDQHITEYYKESEGNNLTPGTFSRVIQLNKHPDMSWKDVQRIVPKISRGWFELSHLTVSDRIEFSRDYWISKLPYHECLPALFEKFFGSLDDIGVFLTQKHFDDKFECRLVYSMSNNGGFYHGNLPMGDKDKINLYNKFQSLGIIFPQDYIAFMEIHNGFAKINDVGILEAKDVYPTYEELKERLLRRDPIVNEDGVAFDPSKLIPFYHSFGTQCFQCFFDEWHPENEIGNVYYSEMSKTISDVTGIKSSIDQMAFATFSEWLAFYLERVV